jgi:hypothetical protein
MQRLKPEKVHVTWVSGTDPEHLALPRRYTLTHSDRTGDLFITIGSEYNIKQISGLYTRLMRDEVLAEFIEDGNGLAFNVYCHVSGGCIFGTAGFRYRIFKKELSLALEALRYGDRAVFKTHPHLDELPVIVSFQSTVKRYNTRETWETFAAYR